MSEEISKIQMVQDEMENKEPAPREFSQNPAFKSYFNRVGEAKRQRGQRFKFFDDLTYEEDYELNLQAKNSYLRKKRNDDEVRVNTGTAEKKIEATINQINDMNLQHEIIAYDQDDLEIKELGDDIGDIVKRTNQMERDEDMYLEAIEELVTQRAVFVEEIVDERSLEGRGRSGKKIKTLIARKKLLDGRQVYLGDISIPARLFNQQPYIIKYERMSYAEARTIYGTWENWKYVKPHSKDADQYGFNYKWRFGSLSEFEVEILHYFSAPENEWQVIINDVMMFEPGEPLPWEHEGYNMIMIINKPLSRTFAYGKPPLASAKYLQSLENETIRNLVVKMRQAISPPTGVLSGKVYSKDIWSPSAMVQGVRKEDFSKLIDHDGVTQSEFAMFDLITKKAEEFIGSSSLQNVKGRTSATQIQEMQKQAAQMLGHAVYATMRMKREMTYLRIFTILEEYTKPIGKGLDPVTREVGNIYRKFTLYDGKFEDETNGKKVVHFMNRDLQPEEEQGIFSQEEDSQAAGVPLRIRTVNVDTLKKVNAYWYVAVNAQDKDGSALSKAMFTDQLNQAANLSQLTSRPINADTFVQKFESTWRIKNAFTAAQPPQPQQATPGGAPGGSPAQGLIPGGQKPSLNSLTAGAQ